MRQGTDGSLERRSFLFGWFPFFHRRKTIELCGTEFEILRNGRSPRRYVFIHGNEYDARAVIRVHMQEYEGIGYAVTGKEREVEIGGLKLDPNRMFSRFGAERNLRSLNENATFEQIAAVLDSLDADREKLLRLLIPPDGSRLVALHNNRDYSVQSELAASDETSIRQPGIPRNFFLCTDPEDYAVVKQSPFNVVLQSKPNPDDGSLSRVAAKRGFRYVNLECGLGEYEAQLERLRWLEEHLN